MQFPVEWINESELFYTGWCRWHYNDAGSLHHQTHSTKFVSSLKKKKTQNWNFSKFTEPWKVLWNNFCHCIWHWMSGVFICLLMMLLHNKKRRKKYINSFYNLYPGSTLATAIKLAQKPKVLFAKKKKKKIFLTPFIGFKKGKFMMLFSDISHFYADGSKNEEWDGGTCLSTQLL